MKIVITSIVTFISTNIDDIFMLILFYGNRKFKEREIIIGQLAGIMTLIIVSLIGSLIGLFIDQSYVGLLGFLPIYLGIKALWKLGERNDDNGTVNNLDESKHKSSNIFTVAGVTIANGGDNIGIYVPLFATLCWTNKITMITIFLIMTVIWCITAKYLTRHPYIAKAVDKYGHIVTPFVLILLGIYILYENGSVKLLVK